MSTDPQNTDRRKRKGLLASLFSCCIAPTTEDSRASASAPVAPKSTTTATQTAPAANAPDASLQPAGQAAAKASSSSAPAAATETPIAQAGTQIIDARPKAAAPTPDETTTTALGTGIRIPPGASAPGPTTTNDARHVSIAPTEVPPSSSNRDFFSPMSSPGTQTPRRSVSAANDSLPPATEEEAVHEALEIDEPLTPSSAVIPVTAPIPDAVPALGGAVVGAGGSSHDLTTFSPNHDDPSGGVSLAAGLYGDSSDHWLLPPPSPAVKKGKRKCLVLDLDETLVHSSFKVIHGADFVVPVEIDSLYHNVYVIKRPGVDEFMRRCGELFEVVVFTASLAKYADPVLDMLDIHKVVHHRLFRESCSYHMANYVKDLGQLGRPLNATIIIDNSPASYVFHPAHAVPISSWFNDVHDTELIDLVPFLEDLASVDDVSRVLQLALD
ncbi:hypothetical protein PYCC9005_004512 [Savitreella phatthalungensis]